jgi:HIRAN domain
VVALATDWMAGRSMEELRTVHGAALSDPDPLKFAQQLDRIVVNDLAWVLSAVVQFLAAEVPEPLPTALTAMPAMAKYGVGTPAACFAASIGVRNRRDAHTLGELSPAARGADFSDFLDWVGTLTPRQLTWHVSPETAAMFLDRAATLTTPREARDLVLSEQGSILVELRGIGPLGTAEAVGAVGIDDELDLEREHGNTADRNAIAVRSGSGVRLGYLAREHARVLAPLLDLEGGPVVRAVLAAAPASQAPPAAWSARGAVRVRVSVQPRAERPAA